ncbi:MAG: ATP-binding protein [Nitrososphaeria archaeon]
MKEKLKRLNARLNALRHLNQLIVREKNRDKLLQDICDTLVKDLCYYNVWISLFDKNEKFISEFKSDLGTNFLSFADQLKNGNLCNRTIMEMAQPAAVTKNPKNREYFPTDKMREGRICLSARLEYADSIYGVINASAPISSISYRGEKIFFKEIANCIAFALYQLQLEKEKDMALKLLKENEEKFSKIFHNSPIAMTIVSLPDGLLIDINESFLRLTECTREEVIGHSLVKLKIFGENVEKCAKIINLLQVKEGVSNSEVYAQTKSGKHLKLLLSAAKFNVDSQEYAITMLIDTTEYKQVEQALYRAEQEWKRTFDAIPDLIAILDDKHRIVKANQAMAKKLGITPEQVVGLSCYKVIHSTEHPIESCPHIKTLKDGQEHVEEIYDEHLGGYFLVSTTPLKDEKEQIIGSVHVFRDINELKHLEKKLEEYTKHLEELVEIKTRQLKDSERFAAIGQTASMVAHDIRNPLQSIEGAIYLIKEELKSLPLESHKKRELEEIIEIIQTQNDYIDHIVSDLHAFAKTPSSHPTETEIQQVISEALKILRIPDNIQVKLVIQENLRKQFFDPSFLKRILVNLIENAIQAMPKGGELTIDVFEDEQNLHIHVEDTGVGIAEEDKPVIFTPLFTTKAKGQGLGLAVCKKLVEAHNGEISFESKQGKGTRFKIKLPKKR